MKEFGVGILMLLGSFLVFTPMIIWGVLYTIGYSIYMPIAHRNWRMFFSIWWRAIDGSFTTVGRCMQEGFAYKWDEMACVWGEWIEDGVTAEEQTKLGEPKITVSAAIGHLEHENIKMFPRGHKLSNVLNVVFMERRHALGSWLKKLEMDKIDAMDLKGKKK